MKKIQIIMAVVALFLSSAGVLANRLMPVDKFYQSTSATDLTCSTAITVQECFAGNDVRCVIDPGLAPDLYISKKVGGTGPCIQHMRPL